MSFPSEAFFASVYQTSIPNSDLKITNFPLPSQSFFIGIPYLIGFVIAKTPDNAADALYYYNRSLYDSLDDIPGLMDYIRQNVKLSQGVSKKIGLYGTDGSKDTTFQKTDNSFPESKEGEPPNIITKGVMMYTSHGFFQYGTQLYYFSTLDNGTTLYYEKTFTIGFPPFAVTYTLPAIFVTPDNAHKYNVYRYFTYLNYGDVNLNITPSFLLGWGSSDITGDYGADVALLSMYKENDNTQQGSTLPVTYNYTVDSSLLISGVPLISTIPSGRYYYVYDFVSATLAAIQARNFQVYYPVPPDSTSIQQTPAFTFITQFLQSITTFPTSIAPGGTTTIIPDFGIGYPLNTYQITVNDATNSTRRAALPYNYTPPTTVNTVTYTITVNGSTDTNDTNTRTTTFIAYQYVANLAVATRVIESALNYVTWTKGSLSEQFQYGSTPITTNGSSTFTSGNPVDTGGLTAGVGYLLVPTNVNERNPASGAYPTVYFDSITANTLIVASASSQQQYTLTWKSYYIFNSPAPDGPRQYPVTLIGNGVTKTFTSLYNVVLVPFSEVVQNVPYTVQVLDIIVGTNVYFFDIPYDITITPSRINFVNTITWTAFGNQPFEVQMGQSGQQYFFQDSSPIVQTLTENVIQQNGEFSFRPIGSTAAYIIGGIYHLSANTISIPLSSSIPIFSGVFFSYDIGAVFYRDDTYSLSLYRNGAVLQELEATVDNPFTWFPFKYAVTYQPGDQVYVKSNQHLNYGISAPFTFVVNASVVLDQSEYTLFSTIVATMTIDADTVFDVELQDVANAYPPIPLTYSLFGKVYTLSLNSNVRLNNYRVNFILRNSPTIIVTSDVIRISTPVTLDQSEYTILSRINATLYVNVPTTFTVQVQDVENLLPPITLPSFTANLLTTYSFDVYPLNLSDGNYVIYFTSDIVLTSPVFFVSRDYFSLTKPVIPIPPSRGTSNQLCVTAKKNNVASTIISIVGTTVYPTAVTGKPQFLVPCGILRYLKELSSLLATMSLRDALIFLIQKYDIPQSTPAVTNKARIQYPTANFKVLKPIVQYPASFRLAASTTGVSVGNDLRFVDKLSDARFLTLCNDDTKTFSTLYTDMLKNATYWLSTLPPFTKDGDFTYCVVRPVNGSLKQILTASITLVNNRFVFTPYILRLVLAFYQPYGAIDMTIMYNSKSLVDIYNYLVAAYEKIYLNPATAL